MFFFMRREGDSSITWTVYLLDRFVRFASNLTQKLFESRVKVSQTFTPLSSYKKTPVRVCFFAERGGFEPPKRLPVYILSKDARSTTLPSLQYAASDSYLTDSASINARQIG